MCMAARSAERHQEREQQIAIVMLKQLVHMLLRRTAACELLPQRSQGSLPVLVHQQFFARVHACMWR